MQTTRRDCDALLLKLRHQIQTLMPATPPQIEHLQRLLTESGAKHEQAHQLVNRYRTMSVASVILFIDTLIVQNSPSATAKQLSYLDDLFKKRYRAERPQHIHLTKAEASGRSPQQLSYPIRAYC